MASQVRDGLPPRQRLEAFGGWASVLGRLLGGDGLSTDEAEAAFSEILLGEATPAQIAGFVIALRSRGETVEEMAGFVRAMLSHAVPLPFDGDVVDTCGTGGDRRLTINISTLAALVLAGGGVAVCKHGNRAASSLAGSADVLEALGVAIELGPEGVARCIREAGIGFCLAPLYHAGLRHAGPVRRELGVPTVFNFLGPLANPARARYQVVGVADGRMAEKMAGVLVSNGAARAMVVYGEDGLDELSTTSPSWIIEVAEGEAPEQWRRVKVDPASLGLRIASLDELRGGDAAANALAARRVLAGELGPHRDVVALNAAAGFVVAGRATSLAEGLVLAAEVLSDGRAAGALDDLVRVSQEVAAGL